MKFKVKSKLYEADYRELALKLAPKVRESVEKMSLVIKAIDSCVGTFTDEGVLTVKVGKWYQDSLDMAYFDAAIRQVIQNAVGSADLGKDFGNIQVQVEY